MLSNTKRLKMNGEEIWKGEHKHNGTLLKVNENSFTIGYSALLSPDGTKAKNVSFGDGVFYNATEKNNRVYAGIPTVPQAKGVFAGILSRESAIASGYPGVNNEISSFQNGLLVKEGFVIYKEAYIIASKATKLSENKANLYDNTKLDYKLVISSKDGKAYFSPDETLATSTDIVAGKIIELNPDDKSVTVRVFPVSAGGTGGGTSSGGITIVTTADIQDNAVTTEKLADGSITTEKIANGTITKEKIAEGVIPSGGGGELADGSVTSAKIADKAIGYKQLAQPAVYVENIADGHVTSDKIADEAITSAKLAIGSVKASAIADNSITGGKIKSGTITSNQIATETILGSNIQNYAIGHQQLAAYAVNADNIQSKSIATYNIADKAITKDKLADDLIDEIVALVKASM